MLRFSYLAAMAPDKGSGKNFQPFTVSGQLPTTYSTMQLTIRKVVPNEEQPQ